jgi:hypothetical protein
MSPFPAKEFKNNIEESVKPAPKNGAGSIYGGHMSRL